MQTNAGAPEGAVDRGALVLMASTVLMWAGSWIAMKLIVPYIGPFDFVSLRHVLGGVVLLAVAAALRRPLRMGPCWGMTALVALTQIAGFQGLVQWALVSGGVGKISLMAYTMPFWVVLFSWVFLGDRPRGLHWAGIGLAALGLVCVIEPWHALGDTLAVLLGLAGGLCWGVATVVAKMALARYNPDVVAFTAWQMLLGGLMLAPVAWLAPQITAIWNLDLVLGMAYVVLAASAGGWLLWFLVVRRLPASIAGLSSLAVPICAALLAWLLLGERPDPVEGLGMAIILAGLFVVSRATSHPAPAAISPVPRNLQ